MRIRYARFFRPQINSTLAVTPTVPALSVDTLLLCVALLVAAAVAGALGRGRKPAISLRLIAMLVLAVLASRIVYVALQFEHYRILPRSVLALGDGGFNAWAGIIAALLFALWQGWRHGTLRQPLALGLACGALVWGGMLSALLLMPESTLPKTPLTTLEGAPVNLVQLAAGRPMVINLWATWCPPCRREMPLLAQAQKQEPGIRFVFVNQGETADTAQRYLASTGLDLKNVLLDPGAKLAPEVGAGGLPTTLFYNGEGRLVDTHIGQLTSEALAAKLDRLKPRSTR